MIGETTVLEMFNLSDGTFLRSDTIEEDRKMLQGSVGINQEQHIAMESCTARFVGIPAASSNSI